MGNGAVMHAKMRGIRCLSSESDPKAQSEWPGNANRQCDQESNAPDIVTLQELDHFHFMQNELAPEYTSTMKEDLFYAFRRDGQDIHKDTSIKIRDKHTEEGGAYRPSQRCGCFREGSPGRRKGSP